jgi:hypothetical protein
MIWFGIQIETEKYGAQPLFNDRKNSMNRKSKKKYIYGFFLSIITMLFLSCASTPSANFKKKIQSMSNNELINYYDGIDARLKDIETGGKENDRLFKKSHDEVSVNMKTSFYLSGEGQDLLQKRKAVVNEFEKRNIALDR